MRFRHKTRKMSVCAFWVPFVFCAALSGIVLGGQLAFGTSSEAVLPVFYCFLPMAFFFVGAASHTSHRELKKLRLRLDKLESQDMEGKR